MFTFNECFYLISEDEWSEYFFIYTEPRYGQPPEMEYVAAFLFKQIIQIYFVEILEYFS